MDGWLVIVVSSVRSAYIPYATLTLKHQTRIITITTFFSLSCNPLLLLPQS